MNTIKTKIPAHLLVKLVAIFICVSQTQALEVPVKKVADQLIPKVSPPTTIWSADVDANSCTKLQITPDGGFVVLGVRGVGDSYTLIKYDRDGNKQWNTFIGPEAPGPDTSTYITSVSISEDGGYYCSGYIGATAIRGGNINVGYSCLINANGEVTWVRNNGNQKDVYFSTSISIPYITTSKGENALITGVTIMSENPVYPKLPLALRFINRTGVVYTEKLVDTLSNLELIEVPAFSQVSDGGYIGYYYPTKNNSPKDWRLIKLDKNGTRQWLKTWQESDYGLRGGCAALELSDGSYVVANTLLHTASHLRKFSADGTTIFDTRISDERMTIIYALAETKDHKILLAGSSLAFDTANSALANYHKDFFIAQANTDGTIEWQSIWGAENQADEIKQIAVFNDGNFIIAGQNGLTGKPFIAKIRPKTSSVAEQGTQQAIASMVITESQEGAYRAEYTLSQPTTVTLKVYSSMGNEVASVIAGSEQDMGVHTCMLPTDNLSSGMYYVRLSIGNQILAKPIVIIR